MQIYCIYENIFKYNESTYVHLWQPKLSNDENVENWTSEHGGINKLTHTDAFLTARP